MAFEEMNAQAEVMDRLFGHASAVKALLISSPLLRDERYSKARATLEEAARLLVQAQDEIGAIPRVQD